MLTVRCTCSRYGGVPSDLDSCYVRSTIAGLEIVFALSTCVHLNVLLDGSDNLFDAVCITRCCCFFIRLTFAFGDDRFAFNRTGGDDG